ncbi:MAG: hypothetical protein Q4D14_04155 [Bacteroidales bacterium]|nr:hypothetical protein [Bacteroidales bacterium]
MENLQQADNQNVAECVRAIRQQVFALRNGEIAAQMARGGVNYSKNYGLLLPQLKMIASQYERSMTLSEALLDVDAREYRLLSLMLFPLDATMEQLEARIQRIAFREEAEIFALTTTPKMDVVMPWLLWRFDGRRIEELFDETMAHDSAMEIHWLVPTLTLYRSAAPIAMLDNENLEAIIFGLHVFFCRKSEHTLLRFSEETQRMVALAFCSLMNVKSNRQIDNENKTFWVYGDVADMSIVAGDVPTMVDEFIGDSFARKCRKFIQTIEEEMDMDFVDNADPKTCNSSYFKSRYFED